MHKINMLVMILVSSGLFAMDKESNISLLSGPSLLTMEKKETIKRNIREWQQHKSDETVGCGEVCQAVLCCDWHNKKLQNKDGFFEDINDEMCCSMCMRCCLTDGCEMYSTCCEKEPILCGMAPFAGAIGGIIYHPEIIAQFCTCAAGSCMALECWWCCKRAELKKINKRKQKNS